MSSLSFKIDISVSLFLLKSPPPPRVDTTATAIAESGVATLDRVAVSDKKMKMMYIKWGKVEPVRLCNSAEPDDESEE